MDKRKVKLVKEWRDKTGRYIYILKKCERIFPFLRGRWFEACTTYDYKLVVKWKDHYKIAVIDIEVDHVDSTNSTAPLYGST